MLHGITLKKARWLNVPTSSDRLTLNLGQAEPQKHFFSGATFFFQALCHRRILMISIQFQCFHCSFIFCLIFPSLEDNISKNCLTLPHSPPQATPTPKCTEPPTKHNPTIHKHDVIIIMFVITQFITSYHCCVFLCIYVFAYTVMHRYH